jgi:DNA invertase Pin-like site-specific DNA recombinase
MPKIITKAVSYTRTSSAANTGPDKDSVRRQTAEIKRCAKRLGFALVDAFDDPAVSGVDLLEARPGFAALLDRIDNNGVRVVVVEDASRLARDLVTQELGIAMLIKRGVRVFSSNGDELTASDDPMRVAMRQITGAFTQLEKARLVSKLKSARDQVRAVKGKCEGRLTIEQQHPLATATARQLRKERYSLREISAQLAARGMMNERGVPFNPKSILRML